jgi:hypothetical protein
VLRLAGFRFYSYSHEPNEPPHIHIDRAGASAKFWLETVSLATNMGYNARELAELDGLVRAHRHFLLEAWHEFFGDRG